MPVEQNNKNGGNVNAMRYAALGTQMMVLLGLGVWGGLKLDARLQTSPLFLVVLPVVALVISLVQLYRQLVKPKK
jgi:F0F1-type ATP synthase assembly protein I